MPRLGSQSNTSYNPAIDDAQNVLIAELQQNSAAIRVGTGVPTDSAYTASGGTIPASTALSPIWIDRATGNTYWRDGATNTWLALGTGASVPTYSYPLLIGSGDYTNFESLTTTTDPVRIARVFEQQTGTYNIPLYAASDLENALDTANRSVVYSFKPTMSDMVAQTAGLSSALDTFLAALAADLGAVSQNRRVYMCVHHEPIPDYDAADFVAAFEWFADKIIALGRADIIPTAIYRGNGDWETSGLNNAARNTIPDGWAGASTARAWDWLPDPSYAPNIVLGFDVYSYYPSYTSNTSSSNDRSLRHLMRLILPLIRARGFYRWGIAENAMQKPQADPQYGGGTNSANRATTDWSNTDRLQRLVGLNPPTDETYNFQSNTVNHPAYLPWLTALEGPFPASGTITDPYDTSQFGTGTGQSGANPTSPTQFKNPGQAYDPGSNGCEYYTWFNSDVGSQGDYTGLNTAIADALQDASA